MKGRDLRNLTESNDSKQAFCIFQFPLLITHFLLSNLTSPKNPKTKPLTPRTNHELSLPFHRACGGLVGADEEEMRTERLINT